MMLAKSLLTRIALAGLALCPWSEAIHAQEGDEAPARPNVVVFIVDDLGFGDVGFHGGEAGTPNVDRLAAEGLSLERFYVNPICSLTRASFMTGRDPLSLGLHGNFKVNDAGLALEERMLPEAFREAGYQTALVGKWHLGGRDDPAYLPRGRGFDHFYGFLGGSIDAYTHRGERGRLDWQRNGAVLEEEGYSTELLAAEASGWLRARDPARPFLLVVAFHVVHTPVRVPAHLERKYRGRPAMHAVIHAMDEAVGEVLGAVDEAGLRERTLVLFMSDNGGDPVANSSNGPFQGTKGSLDEGGIHVPAVLRWPGVLEPGRSAQVVSVADLFPTLASAAGVEPGNARPFDGRDRWDLLRSGRVEPPERVVLARNSAALLDGRWKLIASREAPTRLYDLEADPTEQHDLAAAQPEVVRRLEEYLASRGGARERGGLVRERQRAQRRSPEEPDDDD